MSYEKAKRYIERELSHLKSIKNDKEERYIIRDSITFLKQKQRDINKLIKKEAKQTYILNEVFDENKLLKQKNKELKEELKEKNKELKDELKKLHKQKKETDTRLKTEIMTNKYNNKELKQQLKAQKKELQTKIKQHQLTEKRKEDTKIRIFSVTLNVWQLEKQEKTRKTNKRKNNRDTIIHNGIPHCRMIKNRQLHIKGRISFLKQYNNVLVENKNINDDKHKNGKYKRLVEYIADTFKDVDKRRSIRHLLITYASLIKVTINDEETAPEPYDPVNTDLHDNINNHSIFFKYIDYKINPDATTFSELITSQPERIQNSCYVNIIYDTYCESIKKLIKEDSQRNKINESKKFSIEKLCEMCNIKHATENIGLSLQKSLKFFEYYRLGLKAINIFGDTVMNYEPQTFSHKISPRTLYILVHNDHCYKLECNINNHSIFFKYIDYKINPDATTFSELITSQPERIQNSCYVNIIYDTYNEPIGKLIK